MNTHQYRAYLLRLWREGEHGPWRATLEDPHTGERIAFATADKLLAYLSDQLGAEKVAANWGRERDADERR
jgi:hypothetical protein